MRLDEKQHQPVIECINEDKKIVENQSIKIRMAEEKWDERCKQAIYLYNQGIEYPDIAKRVGCNVSNLYKELKKRGELKMPRQVKSSKSLRLPTIPKTKKLKFERYKSLYMYKW